jgi:hypothetical protein
MENPAAIAKQFSETAVEYAKSFNVQLDYTEANVNSIEDILEFYHKDLKGTLIKNIIRKLKKEEPTESQIWSMSTIWGAYIGELICRFYPNNYKWVFEDTFGDGAVLHLKSEKNTHIFPVDKVYKRLKNGAEDSILSFYEIFKLEEEKQ